MSILPRVLLVTLGTLTACACRSNAKPPETPQLPSVLVVPPEATDVVPSTRASGEVGVTYKIREDFPADVLLARIRTALSAPEWRPLEEDWLNPGMPTSHQEGWTYYLDGTKTPEMGEHLWLAQWEDSKGNVVWYALRYRSKPQDAPLYRNVPDNSNLSVTAVWVPARLAKQIRSTLGGR